MNTLRSYLTIGCVIPAILAAPTAQSIATNASVDVPGEYEAYNTDYDIAPPYPGASSDPVPAQVAGPPGADDLLFQNLITAEWLIYSFYQYGVQTFNESSFTDMGLPNTTYQRIQEIRDNEAGHLRIFQDSISPTSLKPGGCQYLFADVAPTPDKYVAVLAEIELGSMIFITGLARQANLNATTSALVAIGETEARHETWSLLNLFNADPFGGPADTIYPYANQIMYTLNEFIKPGSCPSANPEFPTPSQNLPMIELAPTVKATSPGSDISIVFTQPTNQPTIDTTCDYYAVFFHGVQNITMPFDVTTNSTTVPAAFDKNRGAIEMVITTVPGAPTEESCVAGPMPIFEQPVALQGAASS